MGLEYLNFDIEIGQGSGREYPVEVRSPAGEAREIMRFPFDAVALETNLLKLQNALLRSGGPRRRSLSPEEQAVQDFGRALFDALIAGEVRSRYDTSQERAASQDKGLRLRLRFQAPDLATLPWEYLYDRRNDQYVCLYRPTPLVRYLELPQRIRPLAIAPPLRILGMVVCPKDLPVLDEASEKGRIERALQGLRARERVELEWLAGQTWRHLQRAMRGGPWHVLHLVGHGRYSDAIDEGIVCLANDDGYTRELRASQFGRLLANHPSLRLVVMNACESARGGPEDIFSSTASILVRRGIPAVIAMQHEITDQAAIELSRAFYEALADGEPVDAAVTEARVAVSLAVNNTVEWGTPVLFMRTPDGRIFDVPAAAVLPEGTRGDTRPRQETEARQAQPEPSRPRAPQEGASQLNLDEHFTRALEQFYTRHWAEASALLAEIVAQQPDYPGAASKLEEARRRQVLEARYAEGSAAYAGQQWKEAIEHLEAVVALDPHYQEAAAQLAEAKRQRTLAELYAEAQRLFEARAWQAVVSVFERIREEDAAYPDPEGLLPAAREMLAAQERERQLAALYRQAIKDMDGGRLEEARAGFEEVLQRSPNYHEAERLLAVVGTVIDQREAEAQRQARQAELSRRAAGCMAARDWEGAEEALRALRAAGAGEDEVAAQLAEVGRQRDLEAQRQQELEELSTAARTHLQAGRWQEAMAALQTLLEAEPDYTDPAGGTAAELLIQARQQRELAELPEPPTRKRGEPTELPEPPTRKHGKPTDLPEEGGPEAGSAAPGSRPKPADLPR